MYIHLYRNQPQGSAITGRLVIDGRWFCNTLERVGYQIPALFYPVKVTMSPKFKRLLPLVCGVPQTEAKRREGYEAYLYGVRTPLHGVRIHANATVRHQDTHDRDKIRCHNKIYAVHQ